MDSVNFVYKTLRQLKDRYNLNIKQKMLPTFTGVSPIDEATAGMIETDFMVIGSVTGAGKTTISSIIGANNAMQGKKVVLFALEAYEGEIEDRIKFGKLRKEYYNNNFSQNFQNIRFKSWYRGEYPDLQDMEQRVIDETPKDLKENLFIRYRDTTTYTIEQFKKEIAMILDFKIIDLIIIDHLHYFSFPDKETENRAIKEVVNNLRDVGLHYKIPIILISHLRKKDKFKKTLVPDLEEFHGSSEITKNASVVVTMAPAFEVEKPKPYLFPTYFKICKDRFGEGMNRYIMSSLFDASENTYHKDYRILKLKNDATEIVDIEENERPYWAKNVKIKGHYEKRFGK